MGGKMRRFLLLLLVFVYGNKVRAEGCATRDYGEGSVVCVCNATYCDTLPPPADVPDGQFLIYHSNKAGHRFHRMTGNFSAKFEKVDVQFVVNRLKSYQTMFGFGGAMTDAAGINIASLSEQTQQHVLWSYFSPEGLQFNILRVPVGGSDFSTRAYSYADTENDINLEHFNLTEEDYIYKIPYIKKAKSLNPDKILLLGAPWSAPKWMKTNNAFNGAGQLKKEYYQIWADYFVRFLDAYKEAGLQFDIMSPQNEPFDGFMPNFLFNCMGWTAAGERDWVGTFLAPTLEKNGYGNISLIIMDDQRPFLSSWAKEILTNATVKKYVSGIGIHWYIDRYSKPTVLSEVHDAYPDVFLLYTEACNGVKEYGESPAVLGSWERGEAYAKSIIETTNNWVTGWVDWNLALDEIGGPNWSGNFVDAAVIVNATADEFYKQPTYYILGHFSKFVPEGSQRIELSTESVTDIENIAFINPAGNTVIVFLNRKDEAVPVAVSDPDHGSFNLDIDARSIYTVIYN